MFKSCGFCQISNIKNSREVQLDLIYTNLSNNITTSIVPESKCIKSNSVHHSAIEATINISGLCEESGKNKRKIISFKKAQKFMNENFLLCISDQDNTEAMVESCNNLLKKYELVTQQFLIIQDKFTRYKSIGETSSSTKPWTKHKEFIALQKKKETYTS